MKLRGTSNSQAAIHASTSQDGRAVASDWSTEKAVTEGLKSSTWVYAAISKISTGLASVPLVLEKKKGDGWEPDAGHELQRLLNRPNPFMGRQDVLERWVQHMMLGGNALWWLNIVGGKPVEMWPISPDQIKPLHSRADFIGGYEWRVDSSTKRILPVAEVAHWMFPDPSNPRWGLAPLQAAAGAVDMDLAAARWNRAVLANDGKPPLAVFLSDALSIEQMRQASGMIREQINGGSIRQALVLGGASKVQPLSLNAADLDFLNGRRFSREEIAAVFGVPPVLLSFGEAATYANLDAAKTALWEDRIVPLLDDLCNGLEGSLFPLFGLTEETHRIRADLSVVRALQANLKTEAEVGKLRAEAFKALVDAGVPANMAATAAQVPLTDIPGGDQPRAAPAPAAPPQVKSHPPPVRMQRKDKGEDDVAARLARMDEWTAEIKKRVAEILLEQGSAVASAYAAGQPWEDALSLDDWQALLEAIHTAAIEAEGAVAYTALLKSITGSGAGGAFDVLADGVVEWIDSHVGDMVKGITDTSKAALRAEIRAGVEAGESTRDIAKRLRALSEEWSGYRAERIARTEVGASFGAAHDQAARQIGVPMTKTWVATGDSRTRDEHAAMDGETVDLDDSFSNGASTAPEGVNCRCLTIYQPKKGR
ncbi:phage portal protein [Deinococcus sp. S9]|uniref:phage portal protein n=1 Tax=Deinococcus sp. S9 TaxID=2545754 RepID=UPI001055A49E|nr:phage portal protein [Deinococcus sp. S9]TDE85304.1 phage portal protein [Deinococcus sp. S9]